MWIVMGLELQSRQFRMSSAAILRTLIIFVLLLAAYGCAKKKPPQIPVAPAPRTAPAAPSPRAARPAPAAPVGTAEVGIASWYGHPYHGRHAANGEIYDMEKLTAAHRTLPFETWVRVRNTTNNKTIEVRINDRGPFVDGRIIDLSHAAAEAIDLIRPGIAKVRVEVIGRPPNAQRELYAVQVGVFRNEANARTLCERMQRSYKHSQMVKREGTTPVWRVLVGREASYADAANLAQRIGKEYGPVFVVRLDGPAS